VRAPDASGARPLDASGVADLFSALNRCRYCDRTAVVVWAPDVRTCRREACAGLGFSEVRRRARARAAHDPAAALAAALLDALRTFEVALDADVDAELLTRAEADATTSDERRRTALTLTEVHRVAPPPVAPPPRARRFRSSRRVRPPRVRGTARAARASRR